MTIISIEGNIGSGKSTLLKMIKNIYKDNIIFVEEPVNEWIEIKDSQNQNILHLFYQDKEKNAFSFQMLAYITRLRRILQATKENPNKLIICERSIYTDKYVFAKMLYQNGDIREIDWKIYNYWFDTFINETKLDGIIYVNTNPETCLQRIYKRNRPEEMKIPLEYLQECHVKHLEWLKNTKNIVIEFEGNSNFDNIINLQCFLEKF